MKKCSDFKGYNLSAYSFFCDELQKKLKYSKTDDIDKESGKEFVFCKHLALAEQIHDGRFTYVGIAHQCHAHPTVWH